MRRLLIATMTAVALTVPMLAQADEDAGTPKLTIEEFCQQSRKLRVEVVQIRTREWLKRVNTMKAACVVGFVKTGAFRVEPDRISPEMKADVRCPKGPPPGETKESVWNVLSLFLDPPVLTDERITIGNSMDMMNARCVTQDVAIGLELTPLLNDRPALQRILAWKP